MKNSEIIDNFILELEKMYTDIKIYRYFNKYTAEYVMYHTNKKYDVNNKEFLNKLDDLMIENLFEKDIFNFSFTFNYDKYIEEEKMKSNETILKEKDYENNTNIIAFDNVYISNSNLIGLAS